MSSKPAIIHDLEKKLKIEIGDYALNEAGELVELRLFEKGLTDISPLSGLVQLSSLELSHNQISDLSPLSGLVNLSILFLNNNQISDISPLSGLVNLSTLFLNNNQISDLSPLSGLVNLSWLELNNNQISNLSPLSGLVNLSSLFLNNNQISDLSPLSGLVQLSTLFLTNSQISDLSPLSGLVNLSWLELNNNQISDLSPFSGLVNLSSLGLSNNQISDLSPLSSLVNLSMLDLSDNEISDPRPVIELLEKSTLQHITYENDFRFGDYEINLYNNPLPQEVIDAIKSGGKEGLLRYNMASKQRGTVRIPEAKMVLLGEPRAGKTTLQKYLMGLPINENEESTPDIQISAWQPFAADDVDEYTQSIKINLWDFGGQEIQYSLHKLFMTEDTLYVIVLDSTKDQSPLSYLKFLENYAPGSPFIIINNYGDVGTSNTFKLDENYLRETYTGQAGKPHLKGIFKRVSVLQAAKIEPSYRKIMDEVEACIKHELLQLQNLNKDFPKEYLSVKTAIEAEYRQPNRHYITMTYYRELCKNLQVTDDEGLRKAILAYLNQIGVLRYFKDTPSAYHILNPQWLIDGAYSLIMNEQTGTKQGVLSKQDACHILKRSRKGFQFHEDEAEFIFTTMKYYGLLYADEAEQKVYIPLRFSSLQPTTLTDFYEQGKHFYVEFKSDIPEDIIAYLIVKHFEEISRRIYWKNGAIFEKDGVRILAKVEDRRIHFYIQGQYHQLYFESLRTTLLKKLESLPGLGYEEMVEFAYEGKAITAKYDDLISTLKDNWGDYRDYATRTRVPDNEIVKILGGYFSKGQIQQITHQRTYNFFGDYHDNRFQHITMIQELKSLVQLAQNPDDKRALETISTEIQQLNTTKEIAKKESLGRKLFKKIKQLSTDTLDDAVKDKLKELFPQVIEKGIDWIEHLDIEGIMQIFGGIL